jgi:pimeloyl-ACP methyl ester carboxylesterase
MPAARAIPVLVCLLSAGSAFAQDPPAPRDVTLTASDGTPLKATYYAAAKPGPAVMLLHMCNTTRASWLPLGPQLAAAGIHAISMDYRGFGESGGDRFDKMPGADAQAMIANKWPGDVDTAYAFLAKQPGVDGTRLGAAGGSCGVIQAVHFAQRHPEIKSLVLLAGPTDPDGLTFLEQNSWLPVFAAAAADDQYDANAPELMQWILAIAGNPRNKFSGFKDGKHGTEIFGPHPELPKQITQWFVDTLAKNPADRAHAVAPTDTPVREFWRKAEAPDTVAAAVQMLHDARARDPHAVLFPEAALNLLGYQHLQAGRAKEAIALFKLNTEAYPTSANTFDSLGDGYVADGQNDLALQASRTAIELLAADTSPEDRKAAIRASAEQKIAKLTKREN